MTSNFLKFRKSDSTFQHEKKNYKCCKYFDLDAYQCFFIAFPKIQKKSTQKFSPPSGAILANLDRF